MCLIIDNRTLQIKGSDKMNENAKGGLSDARHGLTDFEEREKQFIALRNQLQHEENQLHEYKARLKHEQLIREKKFQKDMNQQSDAMFLGQQHLLL